MESFSKQPYEQYDIVFDYYGRLPPDPTLTLFSATASAWNTTDDADATGDVLQSTTCEVTANKVTVGVKGGVTGKSYQITIQVICSDAATRFEDEVLMSVAEL